MVFTYSKRFNKFCTIFSSVIFFTFSDFSFSFKRFLHLTHTAIHFYPIHYCWCHCSPKMYATVQLECCNMEEAKQALLDTLALIIILTLWRRYNQQNTTFPTIHEQDDRGLRRNVRTTISDRPIYGFGSRPQVWLQELSRDIDQSVLRTVRNRLREHNIHPRRPAMRLFYSHDIVLPD